MSNSMETNLSQQSRSVGILPEDLLVEILVRQPVRQLLALRCVSQSWCGIIDDINFVVRHHQVQYAKRRANNDLPLFFAPVDRQKKQLQVFHLLAKQQGDVTLNVTTDLVRDSEAYFANDINLFHKGICLGVVNGVVCFMWNYELSLWNPATREFKAVAPLHWPIDIPKISIGHTLVGFGFDSVTNDFKIVRQSGFSFTCHTTGVDIYSLNTNSWKRIRSSPLDMRPYMKFNMQAFLNGVGYWLATWTNDEHRRRSDSNLLIIMSFNFTSEVFRTFDVPEGVVISFGNDDEFDYDYTIIPYLERFAFVVKCTDLGNAVTNFDIWVVDQFCDDNSGTPMSWQRLPTIGPFPSSDEVCLDVFRMDGDVLGVIGMEEEATLYDPTKGCFKNLGVKSSSVNNIFVESLYPLSKRIEGALTQ